MLPSVREDSRDVGMMPSRNPMVPPSPSPWPASVTSYSEPWMFRPSPGWMRLPTTRPMPSAMVDIAMK